MNWKPTLLLGSGRIIQSLIVALVVSILSASAAHAYFSPEEVLLNKDLYLPPTARDAEARAQSQSATAAERRSREQEAAFEAQRPIPVLEDIPVEDLLPAAPAQPVSGYPSAMDIELASTLRLLDRLEERQRVLQYGGGLHGGAPLAPLAPTGAGAWLAGITMIASVLWTVARARKSEQAVHMVP